MIYVLKWLVPFWAKYKKKVAFIILLGMLSAGLRVITPLIIKNIVNGFQTNPSVDYLTLNALVICGVGILSYIVGINAAGSRAWMNIRFEWDCRQKVYEHILKLDNEFFSERTTGDIITRLIDDIYDKISWFSCSGVFRFIQSAFTLIAVISTIFYLNFKLSLFILFPLPFILALSSKTSKSLLEKFNVLQKTISNIYEYLEISFSGIKVIKANSKEEAQYKFFTKKTAEQKKAEIDSGKTSVIFSYFFHYASYIIIIMLYAVGGKEVIDGKITLGEVIAFQAYSIFLIFPLMDIGQFFVRGNRAKASIKRVDELLRCRPKIKSPTSPIILDKVKKVEYYKVSLKIKDKYILQDISFSVEEGSKASVVGKTGCGKSYLLNLLPRFMDPSSGEIRVNGIDIKKYDISSLRSKIGYAPQDASVFSDTLLMNIKMDNKLLSQDNIEKAISTSKLSNDLAKFPKGLDTYIGAKGLSISGGQKQRLQIARALAINPQILILDDTTSAMDADTENSFWNSLAENYPALTCLIATHRVMTIAGSDLIIVLDEGRIDSMGKHNELLRTSRLYRQIYEKEKLEEEFIAKQTENK